MAPFYGIAGTPYSIMVQSFSNRPGGNLLFTLNKQDLLPSSASISFTAKQPVGTVSAAKSITIKNQNSNTITISAVSISANFNLSTNTCTGATLAPGATCSLGATFAPTNTGAIQGAIKVTSNANNGTLTIPVSGTSVYPLSFSVASLAFPTTPVGSTSAVLTATLTNNTSASIGLGTQSVSPDFKATQNCGAALAAGASCTYQVTFSPNRPVATYGVVTVNALTSPATYYLSLSGTGSGSVTTHLALTPAALAFANTFAGTTSAAKTVTVKNTGATAITISGASVKGPFTLTGGTCKTLSGGVLSAGLSCTYIVTFSPNAVGAVKGALTITDNDPTARQIVNLSGTGVAAVTFSPTTLAFGTVPIFTGSAIKSVTITNNQAVAINSLALTTSANYLISSTTCGSTLSAHGSCSANVYFLPTTGGVIKGTLAVSGTQPGSAQLLPLSGTGN
jgi:hypothetical protein